MALFSFFKIVGYDWRIHELDDHKEEDEKKLLPRIM